MVTAGTRVCLLLAAGLLVGCINPTIRLGPEARGTPHLGSIAGTLYETGLEDPVTFYAGSTEAVGLFTVSPAIDGKTLFRNTPSGAIDLTEVPVGTYVLAPLFYPEEAKQVVVSSHETAFVELRYTSMKLSQYLYLNTTDEVAPFSDETIRRAVGLGLDRDAIVQAVNAAITTPVAIMTNFLRVPNLQTKPYSGMAVFHYRPTAAQSLLATTTVRPFTFLNDTTVNAEKTAVSAATVSGLNAIAGLSASDEPVATLDEKTARMQAGSFSAARGGWLASPGNDPLPTFVQCFWSGGNPEDADFSNFSRSGGTALNALIDAARKARDAGDKDDFLMAVIAVNNYLVQEASVIPLYYR